MSVIQYVDNIVTYDKMYVLLILPYHFIKCSQKAALVCIIIAQLYVFQKFVLTIVKYGAIM